MTGQSRVIANQDCRVLQTGLGTGTMQEPGQGAGTQTGADAGKAPKKI